MWRPRSSWIPAVFVLTLTASCSGEPDKGGASGSSQIPQDAGGDTESGVACLDPLAAEVVLPMGKLGGGEFVAYQLSAASSLLFLSSVGGLYSIPSQGGPAKPLLEDPGIVVPLHFLRSSDLVVTYGSKLLTMSFDGTRAELPSFGPAQLTPYKTLQQTIDAVVEDGFLYGRGKTYSPEASILFRHNLATGEQQTLGSTTQEERFIGKAGDWIATARKSAEGIIRVMKTPLQGGDAVELKTPWAFKQMDAPGAIGSDLYLHASEGEPGSAAPGRLIRVPVDDPTKSADLGQAEWVSPFAGTVSAAKASRGVVITVLNALYFVEDGSSSAKKFAELCTADYTYGVAAAYGDYAYVGVQRISDDEGGVIRIPIP